MAHNRPTMSDLARLGIKVAPADNKPVKATKKAKKPIFFNGMELDSNEELWMCWWLEELQQYGFVSYFKRGYSLPLSNGVDATYTEITQLKTKQKVVGKKVCLLREHGYSFDFLVYWTPEGFGKFTYNHKFYLPKLLFAGELTGAYLTSHIEVKPSFDQNNMERLFKINQKWVYDKHGILINLVKPMELFAATFYPKAYLTKGRKIKGVISLIDDFLKIK